MSAIVAIRINPGNESRPRDGKSYSAFRAVSGALESQGNIPVPLRVVDSYTGVLQVRAQEKILFGVLDEETLGDKFANAVDYLKQRRTPILTIAARGKDPYTQIDPDFALRRPLEGRVAQATMKQFLEKRVGMREHEFCGFRAKFAGEQSQLLNLSYDRLPTASRLRQHYRTNHFLRENVPNQTSMSYFLSQTQMELLAFMIAQHDARANGQAPNKSLIETYCDYARDVGTTADMCSEPCRNSVAAEIRFLSGQLALMTKDRVRIIPIRDEAGQFIDFRLHDTHADKRQARLQHHAHA